MGWCTRGVAVDHDLSGLDPHGLGVPELHWMKQAGNYKAAARGSRQERPTA